MEKVTIKAGFAKSPFGICLIGKTSKGICHLSFWNAKKNNLKIIQKDWPNALLKHDDVYIQKLADKIFRNSNKSTLSTFLKGTDFQMSVWKELAKIPKGSFTTYGRLAQAVGKPKAARAVGTAVGQNPVAYLVPCHRVIRTTGAIGGYHWGVHRKRAILAWEKTKI